MAEEGVVQIATFRGLLLGDGVFNGLVIEFVSLSTLLIVNGLSSPSLRPGPRGNRFVRRSRMRPISCAMAELMLARAMRSSDSFGLAEPYFDSSAAICTCRAACWERSDWMRLRELFVAAELLDMLAPARPEITSGSPVSTSGRLRPSRCG